MAEKKRLIYLEDAIALLEKDIAESKDALKYAYPGEKTEIRGEMNGVRASIHILKHHASHGGTVDAEPVVRCKDCKYLIAGCGCSIFKGSDYYPVVTYNDFCSFGERKDAI